jgi:hypothetical protein
MGYDLKADNAAAKSFHFGAFSFRVLLAECGLLWPVAHNGGQWYCVWGADPRMPEGDTYPRLLSNDGFHVTADEARIMARVARNFVAIQRSLPEDNRGRLTTKTQVEFRKADVMEMLMLAMSGARKTGPWPEKIRDDFTDMFERFADWVEKSGGFEIW